jgi:hypothetical protein
MDSDIDAEKTLGCVLKRYENYICRLLKAQITVVVYIILEIVLA